MAPFLSFDQARLRARRRLPRGLFEYIDRGVGREDSLRALYRSLDRTLVTPRALGADSTRSSDVTLFGKVAQAPVVIAPTAMAGLVHRDGEVVLMRVAARRGVPVCLSTQSLMSVDKLRAAVPDAEIWMQLYLWQDRDLSLDLMQRASGAGVEVLVMTVDTPYGVRKWWNQHNGFGVPFQFTARSLGDLARHPGWLLRVVLPNLLRDGIPALGNYPEGLRPRLLGRTSDPRVELRTDLGWADVAWVRKHWPGKLILKGILDPKDAECASQAGADGIVVSSHGARNFDAAPAPIDVLPDIVQVSGQMTVLADSGVRDGLDILRYRSRGAAAVMTGRLPLWALAAGGEAWLDRALRVLQQEYVEALDSAGI